MPEQALLRRFVVIRSYYEHAVCLAFFGMPNERSGFLRRVRTCTADDGDSSVDVLYDETHQPPMLLVREGCCFSGRSTRNHHVCPLFKMKIKQTFQRALIDLPLPER